MSNALAIAAISAALKGLLEEELGRVQGAFGKLKVTAQAPDLIKADALAEPQLNLFLYQAAPNPGWANLKLPLVDEQGRRAGNAPLALDLRYLLTAYAREDFRAEILLGHAMKCFHESPVVTRQRLRDFGNRWKDEGEPLAALAGSGLADQVEQVKISPEPFGVEELSKLWTAFQTSYRPTVAYRVSVALIDSDQPARSALPVVQRGPSVASNLAPPFPMLVSAAPPSEQPSVRPGETLTLTGLNLLGDAGDDLRVIARRPRADAVFELPQASRAAAEIRVTIPADAGALPAGNYVVAVEYSREGKPYRATNSLPFTLAPAITPRPPTRRNGAVTVEVEVVPPVAQGQRASLLLNDREAFARPFAGATAALLAFDFEGLPPGDYWVRLRVDGIESLLVDRSTRPPRFDDTQRVTAP